jgi:Protein of unknown function (DUF3572)
VENSGDRVGNGRKMAETLAAQAFSWVAEDEGRLNAFMVMTGAAPADLVRNVTSAAFLGTVLDYILTEDSLVKEFCDARGFPYTAPMQARAALPGGASWHWT